jgi:hypothetical protein
MQSSQDSRAISPISICERTPPRRGFAAQPEARCVGAHLAGAARTPPANTARQNGACDDSSASAAPPPAVLPCGCWRNRTPGLAVWLPVVPSRPDSPQLAFQGTTVRLATMSVCACSAMTPPADLHFADASLRTAFRSQQSVRVDPTPAGKRGGFCSPVASAYGR